MSQENVDLFLDGADAISRGDAEAMLDAVGEDVVWIAARSAVEGVYHGHEGLRRFLADNAESFELFEPAFDEVRDLGDRVLAFGTFRIRTRGSGVETDFPVAGIATYREGKLVRWEDFASATWPWKPRGCGSRRCRGRTSWSCRPPSRRGTRGTWTPWASSMTPTSLCE